jgi:hypothetical protein
VRVILAWHVRFLLWRALRETLKSQRQLAKEMHVSQSTIGSVVRRAGQYKQASPTGRARDKAGDRKR